MNIDHKHQNSNHNSNDWMWKKIESSQWNFNLDVCFDSFFSLHYICFHLIYFFLNSMFSSLLWCIADNLVHSLIINDFYYLFFFLVNNFIFKYEIWKKYIHGTGRIAAESGVVVISFKIHSRRNFIVIYYGQRHRTIARVRSFYQQMK